MNNEWEDTKYNYTWEYLDGYSHTDILRFECAIETYNEDDDINHCMSIVLYRIFYDKINVRFSGQLYQKSATGATYDNLITNPMFVPSETERIPIVFTASNYVNGIGLVTIHDTGAINIKVYWITTETQISYGEVYGNGIIISAFD